MSGENIDKQENANDQNQQNQLTHSGQGGGQNRKRDRRGHGPGGFCECPKCGEKVRHKRGTPCMGMTCPQCGQPLVRQEKNI